MGEWVKPPDCSSGPRCEARWFESNSVHQPTLREAERRLPAEALAKAGCENFAQLRLAYAGIA